MPTGAAATLGNGNPNDGGIYLCEYNYRSLLSRARLKPDNRTVATYKHDAPGREVEKDLGTSRERYIYSGVETVSVYDSSDAWVRDCVFAEGIDEPLMLRQADVTDFDGDQDTSEVTRNSYPRNALGSVLLPTNMNEAEGVSYRYDPYGAVTIGVGGTPQSDDPLANPWVFTARFQDEETGLMSYRARHYAPGVGRFLQRDPLAYDEGPCLFEYAGSSPTNRLDPLGLFAELNGEIPPGIQHHEAQVPTPSPTTRIPDGFVWPQGWQAQWIVNSWTLNAWVYGPWAAGEHGTTWFARQDGPVDNLDGEPGTLVPGQAGAAPWEVDPTALRLPPRRENFRREGDRCFGDEVTVTPMRRRNWEMLHEIPVAPGRYGLRGRQLYTYGELLRGRLRPQAIVWIVEWYKYRDDVTKRRVEVPCNDDLLHVWPVKCGGASEIVGGRRSLEDLIHALE